MAQGSDGGGCGDRKLPLEMRATAAMAAKQRKEDATREKGALLSLEVKRCHAVPLERSGTLPYYVSVTNH